MIETAALILHLCGPGAVHLAPHFERAAHRWHVPPAVLVAVARAESTCDPDADDGRGDIGIIQVRPGTLAARGHTAAELHDPRLCLWLGARHLRHWWGRCGDLAGALGVYAGHRTCRAGRTSRYAARVLGFVAEATGEPES